MKSKFIKITGITDASNLVKNASNVEGEITLRKGRYAIDCKSIMGIFSIDISTGVTVEYPEDAIEFENFISQFEVKDKVAN